VAELLCGDCIEVMAGLPAASVGAIVTDPPYGLGFMGREWDTFDAGAVARRAARKARKGTAIPEGSGALNAAGYVEYDYSPRGMQGFQSWCEQWGREALRVLKPGGYLLAFGGQRTYHRLACGLEDAGFAITDSLHWLFGSGFPKSLDLERAIAVATCALPGRHFARRLPDEDQRQPGDHVCPVTPESAPWAGYGTALKPAHEPIVLARKPLDGTYAANVARWGVGGLAIDACRVAGDESTRRVNRAEMGYHGGNLAEQYTTGSDVGRWPTNLLLTHHADCAGVCAPGCPVAVLDAQSGYSSEKPRTLTRNGHRQQEGWGLAAASTGIVHGDSGGASRFYPTFRFEADDFAPFLYVAKAARSEREKGLRALAKATAGERTGRKDGSAGLDSPRAGAGRTNAGANVHPTVKPIQLMRWLVRLVTPPGETVLDPFLGSGTTGVAALMEGRGFIGVEREAAYLAIARHRLAAAQPGLPLGA
jgi:DNA modification methylase